MKKTGILLLLTCSSLFFANCHEKAYTRASDRKKSETATTSVKFTEAQKAEGKTIFEGECNKCHDLPIPGEHNIGSWNDILPKMISKAHLTDEKGKMVRAYVISNAKAG